MKTTISVFTCLLFLLTVLYPIGVIITACFGYVFELFSVSGFAIILAALSLCLVVLCRLGKPVFDQPWVPIILAVTPLFSIINAVFFICTCPQLLVVIGVGISLGCCCFLAGKLGKPTWLKSVMLALTGVIVTPVISIGWVWFAAGFGTTANEVVIREINSPNGTYYARVIERDQGALGGNTVVDVHEKSGVDLILFLIEKEPTRVHYGKLGAHKTMQIYWRGEDCLVVDAYEYQIE